MSDIKYDPDYPYVVNAGFGYPHAKFHLREWAEKYAKQIDSPVIDTTPKPKIPEGAEFIMWRPDDNSALEFAECTQGFWAWGADEVSISELIEEIGDAEVTVLVRKEAQ